MKRLPARENYEKLIAFAAAALMLTGCVIAPRITITGVGMAAATAKVRITTMAAITALQVRPRKVAADQISDIVVVRIPSKTKRP